MARSLPAPVARHRGTMSLAGLRDPRRLAAIVLIALAGGIVLAVLIARGELAGADARAYWAAIRLWLGGGEPFVPPQPLLPYPYAPWTMYLFLPWAMLPWTVAWFVWRTVNILLFAWSVAWAYERRPLATALLVVALAGSLAANLDTGNINVLLALALWAAQFVRTRTAGLLWALTTALKWLPAVFIFLIPPRARLWGLGFLALFAILMFATWPETLLQVDVVLYLPRPLRLDYLILAWALVPWLWRQPWPPEWLSRDWLRARLVELRDPIRWLRSFLGLEADTTDTSTRALAARSRS